MGHGQAGLLWATSAVRRLRRGAEGGVGGSAQPSAEQPPPRSLRAGAHAHLPPPPQQACCPRHVLGHREPEQALQALSRGLLGPSLTLGWD